MNLLLADEDARAAIEEAARKGVGHADVPEVELAVGEWFVEIPLEVAPPELREVLRLFGRAITEQLDIREVPWDTRTAGRRAPPSSSSGSGTEASTTARDGRPR